MCLNARLFQQGSGGIVTALFVDAVLFIPVNARHLMLAAYLKHGLWCLLPGVDAADQQGNIQAFQRLAHVAQVAQPEVDFAGSVVVGQPLGGADKPQGDGRAAFTGGAERSVVIDAQVTAQPGQMHGAGVSSGWRSWA